MRLDYFIENHFLLPLKKRKSLKSFWLMYDKISDPFYLIKLLIEINNHDMPQESIYPPHHYKWHDSVLTCDCSWAYRIRKVMSEMSSEDVKKLENAILITPESVRIRTQEVIRMRNAARKTYGLIQDMTVEDRTARIVEIHA